MERYLIASFVLLQLLISFWAIYDISKSRLKGFYSNTLFLLLVILLPTFGALAYFLSKRYLTLPKRRFAPEFNIRRI